MLRCPSFRGVWEVTHIHELSLKGSPDALSGLSVVPFFKASSRRSSSAETITSCRVLFPQAP